MSSMIKSLYKLEDMVRFIFLTNNKKERCVDFFGGDKKDKQENKTQYEITQLFEVLKKKNI